MFCAKAWGFQVLRFRVDGFGLAFRSELPGA